METFSMVMSGPTKRWSFKDKNRLFGMNPEDVADFLNMYGWRVLEHLSYKELAKGYVTTG